MFRSIRLACALMIAMFVPCWAGDTPGVTATEIKIGGIFPLSGPASSIGQVGHGVLAYVKSVNDRGGINGRKIDYVVLDDAYSPPKAFEHARKLVESDEVAFLFSQLGTAGNSAVAKYLAAKRVPTIAIVAGASKFTSVKDYPLTTTGLVSYDTEGKIYAKYLMRALPIKQAKSLKNLVLPTALPGVRISTSESNNMIWTQLQLQRWTGTSWEQFGEILDASSE